jgi:hypothetical protein
MSKLKFTRNNLYVLHVVFLYVHNQVPKKGHGLFADENIEKGAFVMEYVGELISTKELYRRLELSRLFGSHSFFDNLYSKIVNSNVYGKMVIHLSTKSSNIEDYVFFLNYDFEEEGGDYITFTSKKTE